MKNDSLGATGGVCGASRFQNGWWTAATLRKVHHFLQQIRFWAPFWAAVDLEEGPKITFSGIMLEKECKNDT